MAAVKPDKAVGAWTKGLELSKNNLSLQKKIREASQHVVKGSDQRKYLKYIEGNYRQIADLRGIAVVRGTFMKQKFKTQGGLYYLNPDRLLLAIGAPGPAVRVSVRGQKVTVEPDAVAQAWRGMDLERLSWLPSFLSGNLLNSLDDASVTTSEEGTLLHYRGAHEEAWVDTERGVLTRFVRDNSRGGRDDLSVKSYALVDGVWLPQEMRIENHQQGWRATLSFSRWRVNEPQTAHAYETLMSSSNNLSPK
jgi:outer membrane lipoprotein-sorting protein